MPETQKPKLGFCLLAGALAGCINGFFGAGGGMVLVPLLLWLVRLEDKAAFSSAVAVILPLCPDKGSCMSYDENLAPSVYLENDLELLRRTRAFALGGE